jgi:hypothetical protein
MTYVLLADWLTSVLAHKYKMKLKYFQCKTKKNKNKNETLLDRDVTFTTVAVRAPHRAFLNRGFRRS